MTVRVVTPAAEELLDLDLLKQQVEMDSDDRDDLLSVYLAAAVDQLETATQRRFLTQTLEWVLTCWRPRLVVPVAPVTAVASITYVDANGDSQTLTAGADYVVSPCGPTVAIRPIEGACWPIVDQDAAEPITIRFDAGQAAADVGQNVKTAAMLLVAKLFAHRGDEDQALPALAPSNLPPAVEALIASERW